MHTTSIVQINRGKRQETRIENKRRIQGYGAGKRTGVSFRKGYVTVLAPGLPCHHFWCYISPQPPTSFHHKPTGMTSSYQLFLTGFLIMKPGGSFHGSKFLPALENSLGMEIAACYGSTPTDMRNSQSSKQDRQCQLLRVGYY